MKMRMLEDQVLILPTIPPKITEGGIIIPDNAHDDRSQPKEGTVVAVGPGKADENGIRHPVGVKVGEKVLFDPFEPKQIKIDGVIYMVLTARGVHGIVEDK